MHPESASCAYPKLHCTYGGYNAHAHLHAEALPSLQHTMPFSWMLKSFRNERRMRELLGSSVCGCGLCCFETIYPPSSWFCNTHNCHCLFDPVCRPQNYCTCLKEDPSRQHCDAQYNHTQSAPTHGCPSQAGVQEGEPRRQTRTRSLNAQPYQHHNSTCCVLRTIWHPQTHRHTQTHQLSPRAQSSRLCTSLTNITDVR